MTESSVLSGMTVFRQSEVRDCLLYLSVALTKRRYVSFSSAEACRRAMGYMTAGHAMSKGCQDILQLYETMSHSSQALITTV